MFPRVSISIPRVQTFAVPKSCNSYPAKSFVQHKIRNTFDGHLLIPKLSFHTSAVTFAVPKRKPSLRVRRIRWASQEQKPRSFHPCKACGKVLAHRNMICGVGCKAREYPNLTKQERALITIQQIKDSGMQVNLERPKTLMQKELEKYLITPPPAARPRPGPYISSSTAKYRLEKIFELNKMDEDEN